MILDDNAHLPDVATFKNIIMKHIFIDILKFSRPRFHWLNMIPWKTQQDVPKTVDSLSKTEAPVHFGHSYVCLCIYVSMYVGMYVISIVSTPLNI